VGVTCMHMQCLSVIVAVAVAVSITVAVAAAVAVATGATGLFCALWPTSMNVHG